MLRVSDDGGDRAVSDSVSRVWDQDRASGTVAEQGSVQPAIRRDGGASVRKRIGAASGPEILSGGEYGTSHGSAISGALDGGAAETGTAKMVYRLLRRRAIVNDREDGDVFSLLEYLALIKPTPTSTPAPPLDEQSLQIVFSPDPAALESAGWAPARLLRPGDPALAGDSSSGASP